MAKIKVHAGDFEDDAQNMILFNQIQLRPAYKAKVQQDIQDARSQGFWQSFKAGFQMPPKMESLGFTDIEDIEEASEESIKKLGGTIGWGLAGSVLLGPVFLNKVNRIALFRLIGFKKSEYQCKASILIQQAFLIRVKYESKTPLPLMAWLA